MAQVRKTGYLVSLLNLPPLIFKFQFNPDILSEKRAFKYTEADFGKWGFERLEAAKGVGKTIKGFMQDLSDYGSLATATKPLKPGGGSPREFQLEFPLQVLRESKLPEDALFARDDITYDLAVLRSFINPAMGPLDFFNLGEFFKGGWKTPPECSLVYSDISLTCVMTDLNIKITSFNEDGKPVRAEVTATLKEQSVSFMPSTLIDAIKRHIKAGVAIYKNYKGEGGADLFGQDLKNIFF